MLSNERGDRNWAVVKIKTSVSLFYRSYLSFVSSLHELASSALTNPRPNETPNTKSI